jgi:hypothetical protein
MADKIKFKFNNKMFGDFIDKLTDLTKIDKTIKLKIDDDNILMYSMAGTGIMLACKNYILDRDVYLKSKNDLSHTYDVIIPNCDKFVKNLNFIKDQDLIGMTLTYRESNESDDVYIARKVEVKGGKLKVNWLAGEHYEVKDLTKEVLETQLDLSLRDWFFTISNEQLSDVKKLSRINSNNIITVNVDDGKVSFYEQSAWDLEIGNIDPINKSFILNKRFLKCIDNKQESIDFSLFANFILVKEENSNLMLSYEQDFEDEDL